MSQNYLISLRFIIIILLKTLKFMIMTQEIKTICIYQLLIFVTGLGQQLLKVVICGINCLKISNMYRI